MSPKQPVCGDNLRIVRRPTDIDESTLSYGQLVATSRHGVLIAVTSTTGGPPLRLVSLSHVLNVFEGVQFQARTVAGKAARKRNAAQNERRRRKRRKRPAKDKR